ncbi:MAG: metallopeptidase family protein [Propionibacteriaceae bacterium]|jgi:predicted Zn-dependent protease with MMP-like domain|nr:metallopeptidase family protein [Propionibacteriaceae bacterium]
MAVLVSDEVFDQLVESALDDVPDQLLDLLDNVVIQVEDWPEGDDRGLLGLYDGIPLTERDLDYGGVLPDRIVIFREPLKTICNGTDELVEQIRITVVHEIAHHFGIDDQRLDQLGWA